jgi:putative transposase
MAHAQNLRKGRVSIPNHVYHVTATTQHREAVFSNFRHARLLIGTFGYLHSVESVRSLAFVVMPDHFHWLFQLNGHVTLAAVMKSVKGYSAKRIGQAIWQQGYHDHGVRQEADLQSIASYIVANPLRAGLVSRIEDYPHWDFTLI